MFAGMQAIIASGHMCILQTNGPRRQFRLYVQSRRLALKSVLLGLLLGGQNGV